MKWVGTTIAALAAALLVALGAGAASAATAGERPGLNFCGPSQRPCARLEVPLDRTGAVPGTLKLQVERRRAAKPTLPPLVLLVGGPGQSATSVYDDQALADTLGAVRRKRDVIVYDQRGTGLSGALECPKLDKASGNATTAAAAGCAQTLGPARSFYTTRDSADDIETIRQQLGVPKIALLGTSYGTKVALAYAARYPTHVDRLVLDSVVGLDGPSPLYLESLRAVPRVLRGLCGASCKNFTPDPVRDIKILASRLAKSPLRGQLVDGRGHRKVAKMDQLDLLFLLLAGDLEPDLRSVLPGAVRSAVRGDPTPLLRIVDEADGPDSPDSQETGSARDFSNGLFAATSCEEMSLPWSRTAPLGSRGTQARSYVAGLPTSAFGPFPRSLALASDVLSLCARWPEAQTAPSVGSTVPDVPALVLSGTADLRTPLEVSSKVARMFPRGRLVKVPGTGHDEISSDTTGCAQQAAERFLADEKATRCKRPRNKLAIVPPAPDSLRSVAPLGGRASRRTRTLRAIRLSLRDFAQLLEAASGEELSRLFDGASPRPIRRGGLRAGAFRYRLIKDTAALDGFSFVPGVQIEGVVKKLVSSSSKTRGTLRIAGRSAAHGTLVLKGRVLRGKLDGRPVRLDVSAALEPLTATARTAAHSAAADAVRPPHLPIP